MEENHSPPWPQKMEVENSGTDKTDRQTDWQGDVWPYSRNKPKPPDETGLYSRGDPLAGRCYDLHALQTSSLSCLGQTRLPVLTRH